MCEARGCAQCELAGVTLAITVGRRGAQLASGLSKRPLEGFVDWRGSRNAGFGPRVDLAVSSQPSGTHLTQSPGVHCLQPNMGSEITSSRSAGSLADLAFPPSPVWFSGLCSFLTHTCQVRRTCRCEHAGGRAGWGGAHRELRPSSSSPRLQELYYEIVHVLSLMLEDLPQKKQSQSSEKVDEK